MASAPPGSRASPPPVCGAGWEGKWGGEDRRPRGGRSAPGRAGPGPVASPVFGDGGAAAARAGGGGGVCRVVGRRRVRGRRLSPAPPRPAPAGPSARARAPPLRSPAGGAPPPRPAPRARWRRLRRVPLFPPDLPATSLEVGPEGPRGGRGCSARPRPRPTRLLPVAPATTAFPPPAPARAARALRSRLAGPCGVDGWRLPTPGGRPPRPVASRPPALDRSASAFRPSVVRCSGPAARSPGGPPRALRAAGALSHPRSPYASRGRLSGSPALSLLPTPVASSARSAPRFPLGAPSPLPPVWWVGGRAPGDAGAGRGPPGGSGGGGELRGGGVRGGRPRGRARWGWSPGVVGGDLWATVDRRAEGGPPCVTGRQRRGPPARGRGPGTRWFGGRRRGGWPVGRAAPLARLPLSRYLARPGAEV